MRFNILFNVRNCPVYSKILIFIHDSHIQSLLYLFRVSCQSSRPGSCKLRAVNLHVSHEFPEKDCWFCRSAIVDPIVFSIFRTNPRSSIKRRTSIRVFYRLLLLEQRLPMSFHRTSLLLLITGLEKLLLQNNSLPLLAT